MSSFSRVGVKLRLARRLRISGVQSGIFDPRDPGHSFDERFPALQFCGQDFSSGRGDFVVAPSALARFFHPTALQTAALFEAIQQGIQRSDMKLQSAIRAKLNLLADVVAVALLAG